MTESGRPATTPYRPASRPMLRGRYSQPPVILADKPPGHILDAAKTEPASVAMSSTRHAIKPSSRALANLESGAFIDLEDEASKLPQYDPESRPDGLIDLSGAINGLMDDFLAEEMDAFAKSYDFRQGLPGNAPGHE